MVQLFYTTYISVDNVHHEIFRAKVGKGGIKRFEKWARSWRRTALLHVNNK